MSKTKYQVLNELTNEIVHSGSLQECEEIINSDKTGFLNLQI